MNDAPGREAQGARRGGVDPRRSGEIATEARSGEEGNATPGERALGAPLLEVRNLAVEFHLLEGVIPAVVGVDLRLHPGEVLGVVGESACGKSVTARAITRIIPTPPGRIVSGEVWLLGRDLLSLTEKQMRSVRGAEISMIFQEPMTSLNPAFTVGDQIGEAFRFHRRISRKEAWARAVDMLRMVEIPEPARRARDYPHQLSGGMRQRAMIAIALACRPKVLIADEPTTALDVTIQAQILRLIAQLQADMGMSVILITHNLGVVASMANRVMIMYAGRVMEEGDADVVFRGHRHPYTHGLLDSVPRLDQPQKELKEIRGVVPNLRDLGRGCAFLSRCDFAMDVCGDEEPSLADVGPGHRCRCWLGDPPW